MGNGYRFVTEDRCEAQRIGLAITLDVEDELRLLGIIDVGTEEEEVAEDAGILLLIQSLADA